MNVYIYLNDYIYINHECIYIVDSIIQLMNVYIPQ